MNIKGVSLGTLAPLLIEAAKQILDAVVPGDELSDDQKKGIMTGYSMANIWLKDLAAVTPNQVDDQAVESFIALCEDTAQEGGFVLPVFSS